MPSAEPRNIGRAVGLTRAGMLWEAVAAAFWPLGVVLAGLLAALAFGGADLLSRRPLLVAMGLAAGAIDYVTKPVQPEELISKIRALG